ncbi:Uncharacterised protein [Streptococcus dysgalactiae subsp. dysgalactiae]|uniref:Uncharacterized protein n=1 Tax=Streptococcus dysgalactiae subsp. dysgalactiae TaxID=99822 RepID=A0A380JUP5_STRDY|nr:MULTISPECIES: hypothetical protein [Streptococcus]EFY02725.1 hypothetical protein SDD27957_05390 [Streptococcus dysgalactiae subsp. dysgalactiae ATCC 27957]MCB2835625.1 hypothetical protein [Streptococcus dysgalactiae subsp. dysgalactiae]SUN49140.1 Uncharacterised protein [Streptococcus dysgalactiae subsp. dysgalactiae]HEO0884313.1 hypothetical protein [Streptococcus agalactiae]HEO4332705.1 hypothetical protein [Streptococcus agalactiae]
MKILHSKSIIECTELEEVIHQAEMDNIMNLVFELPDYDCELSVTYIDDYHKNHWSPYFLESNLHRVQELLQNEDLKNGVDVFVTEENDLAFKAYGQSYTYQGNVGVLTALVTVTCLGEGRSPIDMSKVFTPPTQASEKNLSV